MTNDTNYETGIGEEIVIERDANGFPLEASQVTGLGYEIVSDRDANGFPKDAALVARLREYIKA